MRNEDRRNKYTENMIKEALYQLLETRPIEKITVTEVCKIADINRSTFYLHYMDCYHVLEKAQEEFCDRLIAYMEEHKSEAPVSMILNLHEIIRKDNYLYLILIRSNNPMRTFRKFTDYTNKFMCEIFQERYGYTDEEANWISYFINAACFSISLKYAHETSDNIEREEFYTRFIAGGLEATSHKRYKGIGQEADSSRKYKL